MLLDAHVEVREFLAVPAPSLECDINVLHMCDTMTMEGRSWPQSCDFRGNSNDHTGGSRLIT